MEAVLNRRLVASGILLAHPEPTRPSPDQGWERESLSQPQAQASWTISDAIRTWRFWGVAGMYFTANFVTQMLMIHQIAYLVTTRSPLWSPPRSGERSAW